MRCIELISSQLLSGIVFECSESQPSHLELQQIKCYAEKLFIAGDKKFSQAKNIFPHQYPGSYSWHYLLPDDIPVYYE